MPDDLVEEMRALPDSSLTQREVNELLDTIAELERKVARHEETLRWVKVAWTPGAPIPKFIPNYLDDRLREIR